MTVGGKELEFQTFGRSLGINAPDLATVASLTGKCALTDENRAAAVLEAESQVLQLEEIPDEVVATARAPLEKEGVYWLSRCIYGED